MIFQLIREERANCGINRPENSLGGNRSVFIRKHNMKGDGSNEEQAGK